MLKKVLLTATVQSHICQFHRPLVKVLHKLGYEVHVAARDNLKEKNGLKLDFVDKVYDVPFSRTPMNLKNVQAYKMLKEIINKENYCVILCNTPVGGIVTRLAASKQRRYGCKVVYTAHGFHFYKGAPAVNWMIYYTIEKIFSRYTDVLITINTEDYEISKTKFNTRVEYIHGVGVDANRYAVVNELQKKQLRNQMGYGDYENIVICVGELLPNKNHIMAIKMMTELKQEFPATILMIAGNGPEEKKLKELIAELEVQDNVKLLGYRTDLEIYQNIADLSVACSRREGLGLNVIEAMLSGNPVVAVDNRGHRDLIIEGKNGYIVQQEDYREMARCVSELLRVKQKRSELGQAANEIAQAFAYENVEKELERIYRTID